MNIAAIIDYLLPGADFRGSLTANTKEAFDNLRWKDSRAKPAWEDLKAAWPEVEQKLERQRKEDELVPQKLREMAIKQLEQEGKLPLQAQA